MDILEIIILIIFSIGFICLLYFSFNIGTFIFDKIAKYKNVQQ